MANTMSGLRYDPRIGMTIPQERVAPRWGQHLLSITLALFVLLSTGIFAVSLMVHALAPEAGPVRNDFADPLVLSGPPRILLLARTAPAPVAELKPKVVPATTRKLMAKRQARYVAVARAQLYLPPLHHGQPDTFAPMDYWSERGDFPSKTNCERFRSIAIDDTVADRDQQPDAERALYESRIRLLMAGRCVSYKSSRAGA
jgi:hypothetical protein